MWSQHVLSPPIPCKRARTRDRVLRSWKKVSYKSHPRKGDMRPNSLRDRHKQTLELEWEEKSWRSPSDRFRARTSKNTQATSLSLESLHVGQCQAFLKAQVQRDFGAKDCQTWGFNEPEYSWGGNVKDLKSVTCFSHRSSLIFISIIPIAPDFWISQQFVSSKSLVLMQGAPR